MAKSIAKLPVAKKFNVDQLGEQSLFSTNPEAALPLLSMIGQAQLSIDDLLGQLSRQFIEQMLILSAQSVAGVQHKGRHTGEVRWHGSQNGVVRLGQSKMQVKRPRLRTTDGEVAVPAYAALAKDGNLSQRIADILVCNVSTRKYARVVHRCAALLHGSSCGRGYPNPTVVYATTTEVRTEFGRPALSMRLSTATATAASVH